MKYIISGGGTGGHIYPALSIIEEIKKRDKEAQVLYIGTKDSLEEELVKKAGIDFKSVRVIGLPRKLNAKALRTVFKLVEGLSDSNKIFKEFDADVVIGTGGYVSFPIVFLAQRKSINTYIQEQNSYPGKANKILAKAAKKVFIAFEDARDRLDAREIINAGNPIDPIFAKVDKKESRQVFNIKDNEKLVVSFGGSGGQESINEAILQILESTESLNFKLIHITGKDHYQDFMDEITKRNIKLTDQIEILDYTYQMPIIMSASDLVIMSSSAISLAEIHALGKSAILIPKSYTADNHQVHNARSFAKDNNAKVIEEEDLDGQLLYKSINKMLDQDLEEKPKENQAAQIIVSEILKDFEVEA